MFRDLRLIKVAFGNKEYAALEDMTFITHAKILVS